jgi:phosphocarrier protein
MISEKIVIRNEVGLHARPAAVFVKTADRFKSTVTLEKDEIKVNGRSILSILTLAAETGSEVILTVDGTDERDAFEALKAILSGGDDAA